MDVDPFLSGGRTFDLNDNLYAIIFLGEPRFTCDVHAIGSLNGGLRSRPFSIVFVAVADLVSIHGISTRLLTIKLVVEMDGCGALIVLLEWSIVVVTAHGQKCDTCYRYPGCAFHIFPFVQ